MDILEKNLASRLAKWFIKIVISQTIHYPQNCIDALEETIFYFIENIDLNLYQDGCFLLTVVQLIFSLAMKLSANKFLKLSNNLKLMVYIISINYCKIESQIIFFDHIESLQLFDYLSHSSYITVDQLYDCGIKAEKLGRRSLASQFYTRCLQIIRVDEIDTDIDVQLLETKLIELKVYQYKTAESIW